MKTGPVLPAGRGAASAAPAIAAIAASAGTAQALPDAPALCARWAGQPRFVLLCVSLGDAGGLLRAWQAWRGHPARCDRLVCVAVEAHPPTPDRIAQAHRGTALAALADELAHGWPLPTPNIHPLRFDGGRVQMLLAWGDPARMLRELALRADAIVWRREPLSPSGTPAADAAPSQRHLAKALARHAAPGATLMVQQGGGPALGASLSAAGFETAADSSGAFTAAVHRPRVAVPAPARPPRSVLVIGAGLAGAFTARALADDGCAVTVLDSHAAPAQETSGQAAGIFHGTVHAADGTHARLLRAAALLAERSLRPPIDSGAVPGAVRGLLRLDARPVAVLRAIVARQGLPPGWVQALSGSQASALAGVTLPTAAWLFPGGGWVAPAALAAHVLAGIGFIGGRTVHTLTRAGGAGGVWQARDAAGAVVAEACCAVLANAGGAARLLAPLGVQLPLQRTRGQTSGWDNWDGSSGAATPLRLPVAGDGYAIPLPGGGLLCGATSADSDDGDTNAALRTEDDQQNFDRLHRLTGLAPPLAASARFGRVGWRLVAPDKLPVAGPVPLAVHGGRSDQVRLWPRESGLYVCTALGGRGITLAPLLGRLLAAQIAGSPLPLEQDLVDAIDPARWLVRQARRGAGPLAVQA